MISITHVRTEAHEDGGEVITQVRWYDAGRDATAEGSPDQVIDWIQEDPQNEIFVRQANGLVRVVIEGDPPRLQADADRASTDLLLSLPRF